MSNANGGYGYRYFDGRTRMVTSVLAVFVDKISNSRWRRELLDCGHQWDGPAPSGGGGTRGTFRVCYQCPRMGTPEFEREKQEWKKQNECVE